MADWLSAKPPLVIGHRGASADAPENTLAAFGLARAQGADGIEFDVQLSADNALVVIHDRDVARTTDGRGLVSQLTLAELKSLTTGGGQSIPTLAEVFELLGPHFLYNVELKTASWRAQGLEAAVADCIRAHHLGTRVLVSSFNAAAVWRARRVLDRDTYVAHLTVRSRGQLRHQLIRAQAAHPHFSQVDAAYMAWAKRRNLLVNVWTVDDPGEARRLLDLGVTGIVTNRPASLRQELGLTGK